MAEYFAFSWGLRGCYMPDGIQFIRVETRRELNRIVSDEIEFQFDHGRRPRGLSKRAIASYVAEVWRRRRALNLPLALPFGDGSNAFFLSTSSNAEWKESEENFDA
jgi:hypothetical protein